jgi:hypothetical protein
MNRKNLTAAVLAGLAGAAGIAGTAQAVNLNPDGLGQVLIYPYYTVRDGNTTLLSVVNTTDSAKAVKVRFNEGYNSREVLDFNLYLSAYDVWTASLFAGAAVSGTTGTPTMRTLDSSCTVPYFFGNSTFFGQTAGVQEFLPYAYTGKNVDGGPTTIDRAAEGHFEIIEMGTLTNESATAKRDGSATAATHVLKSGVSRPKNCQQLVDNWSIINSVEGMWVADLTHPVTGTSDIDIERNSGGLFGGAAVINVGNGTMFTYNAKAIQGYDKDEDGLSNHYRPGNILPNLDTGDQRTATLFFGVPQDTAVALQYDRGVDAISATFMHEYTMNEFNQNAALNASSEWIVTFPTKNWYVDYPLLVDLEKVWRPKISDAGCGGWIPGEPYPSRDGPNPSDSSDPTDVNPANGVPDVQEGWVLCTYQQVTIDNTEARPPFTELFDGEACELFGFENWDQEESPSTPGTVNQPPIVSPPPPGGTPPGDTPFALCYEVNRMKFGDDDIFGDSDLLYTVDTGVAAGWARINWGADSDHEDGVGLIGLPVTGYWAVQYENGFLGTPQAGVLANYGGLFEHRGNVRRSYSGERPSPD